MNLLAQLYMMQMILFDYYTAFKGIKIEMHQCQIEKFLKLSTPTVGRVPGITEILSCGTKWIVFRGSFVY